MYKKIQSFLFFISCNFTFSLMNEKVKLHKMKNEKTTWVFLYTKHSKFWSVLQQKPLISEGRYKQLLLPCRLSWEYYYVYHDKRRKMTSYVQFLLWGAGKGWFAHFNISWSVLKCTIANCVCVKMSYPLLGMYSVYLIF